MTRLEKIIPVGRSSALTARQLADLLETTPREITRSIEAQRRRGMAICSSVDADSGGYYIAGSADELSSYIAERERRTRNIRAGTDALRETLRKMRDEEKPLSADCLATASTEG